MRSGPRSGLELGRDVRLAAIENLKEVELAQPFRGRAIAAAQVKTDAIDAHTLAQLLRANLIPRA